MTPVLPPRARTHPDGSRDSAMHARIRARRAGVRAAARRREQRRLLGVALALLVAAGLWALAASPVFDARSVTAQGANGELTAQQRERVLARAGLRTGINIWAAPTGAVEEAVEQLPWVAAAEVRRRPPAHLRIEVRQREPIAVLATPATRWLLDADGVVTGGGARDGLPLVAAPRADPVAGQTIADPGVRAALRVQQGLGEDLAARVTSYTAPSPDGSDGPDDIRLELATAGGPLGVRIGRATQLEAKSEALRLLLAATPPELLDAYEADLRVPTRPVLARS